MLEDFIFRDFREKKNHILFKLQKEEKREFRHLPWPQETGTLSPLD